MQLASELTERSRAEFFDFFAFGYSSSWPEDMPVQTRIAFRMIQVRILSLLGKDTKQHNTDLDTLMQSADGEALRVALGALLFTGPLNPAADSLLAARRALQASRLYLQLPIEVQDSTAKEMLASLLWTSLRNIKSRQDIRHILTILKELSTEERQAVFAHEELCEAPRMFVDKCWSLELKRPKEERDWQGVFLLLEEISLVAEQPGGKPLQAPIARTRAIILADYMEQPQNALTVIEDALSAVHGYDRFLLNYTAGNILLDYSTPEAALARYRIALENPPVVESSFYFDAMRRGAEAAARSEQWQLSRNFALRGLKYFSAEDGLYESLEVLGELAWVHWKLGNYVKAWGAMAGMVRNLLQHQDVEDRRFREVFAKTGHALGWMASMAELGKPPFHTTDGEPYTEPFPGFFSRSRPQLADFPLPPFFHILFSQLALMANGCKLYKLAQRALHQANRAAEEKRVWFLQYVNSLSLAELAAREENYNEALRLAIPGIYVRHAIRTFKDSQFNLLTTQSSPEDFLKDLSEEQRRDAEYDLYWVVVGPALLRLFAQDAPLESCRVVIADLENLFQQSEHKLIDLQFWLDTFRDLRLAFSPLATRETLLEQIRSLSEEGLRILPYCLALSRIPEISLSASCGAQVVTFDFLFRALPASKLMVEDVTTYIFRYWRRVVSTEAFALRNARGLIEAVESIQGPTTLNIAALLLLAADATDTRLSSELRQSLTKAAHHTTAPG